MGCRVGTWSRRATCSVLPRLLNQRRDRPADAADAGSQERLWVFVFDDLETVSRGEASLIASAEMINLRRLRTGGDGVVGPYLPTLHRARVSDLLSAAR